MVQRIGAKKMGLKVSWQYQFVGAVKGRSIPNMVFLDVGNVLGPGAIDQHQDHSLGESTTDLILKYPHYVYDHLMSEWEQAYIYGRLSPNQSWKPTLLTHYEPDFDGVASIFLVHHLIEHGALPVYAPAFVEYCALIDQGRMGFRGEESLNELHLVFLQLQSVLKGQHHEIIMYGLALLNAFFEGAEHHEIRFYNASDFNFSQNFSQKKKNIFEIWKNLYDTLPEFENIENKLNGDAQAYADDLKSSEEIEINLPTKDGKEGLCKGLIFKKEPKSDLFKYRARQEYPFMLVFFEVEKNGQVSPNHTKALPSLDESRSNTFCLQGLGYALEQKESEKRKQLNQRRTGIPRFEASYAANNDPWYDGRGHAYTIVDAPRDGSLLDKQGIIEVVKSGHFWKTRVQNAVIVVLKPIASVNGSKIFHHELTLNDRGKESDTPILTDASDACRPRTVETYQIGHSSLTRGIECTTIELWNETFDEFKTEFQAQKKYVADEGHVLALFQLESYVRFPKWLELQLSEILDDEDNPEVEEGRWYSLALGMLTAVDGKTHGELIHKAVVRSILSSFILQDFRQRLYDARRFQALEQLKLDYHHFRRLCFKYTLSERNSIETLYQKMNVRLHLYEQAENFEEALNNDMVIKKENRQDLTENILFVVGAIGIYEVLQTYLDGILGIGPIFGISTVMIGCALAFFIRMRKH